MTLHLQPFPQIVLTLSIVLVGCRKQPPDEQYGFLATLGQDTVSVERVARYPNRLVTEEVDRFPDVRRRHTEFTLNPDGSIQRMDMRVSIPSARAPASTDRHIVANFTSDTVRVALTDRTGTHARAMATEGLLTIPHVPQMYSLYELYFAAALAQAATNGLPATGIITTHQFYPDREFSNYPIPMHHGYVKPLNGGRVEIQHDWLAGTGTAVLDSTRHMLSYSGARTTYKVAVTRLADPPDVAAIGAQFAATEHAHGALPALSVRDTVRASIGGAHLVVDYGRPLARGRTLLGDVIPYNYIWRTGANQATQFSTSATVRLGNLTLEPGTYTLWTLPERDSVGLIVNRQHGQWGTQHDSRQDIGMTALTTSVSETGVEKFTITIEPKDQRSGTLSLAWGPFRWTTSIIVQ
jgi:hypothetical protein